jgi:uncharacterized membrane protein
MGSQPTGQAPDDPNELARVVRRNIRTMLDVRRATEREKAVDERVADAITSFTGSMKFVYLHAAFFGGWLAVNVGAAPGVRPFDPFPFVMLAMIASVEAIFLSTFVLISQNRMAALADKRADLDLQINLLAEHEVTRLIGLVDRIAARVGVAPRRPHDLDELKQDVQPERVLEEIEAATAGRAAPAHAEGAAGRAAPPAAEGAAGRAAPPDAEAAP